jgi:predicted Holliday junction resolvase-like endonuclease
MNTLATYIIIAAAVLFLDGIILYAAVAHFRRKIREKDRIIIRHIQDKGHLEKELERFQIEKQTWEKCLEYRKKNLHTKLNNFITFSDLIMMGFTPASQSRRSQGRRH